MKALIKDIMAPAVCVIQKFRKETQDTFTLELSPPEEGFSFSPGQFNMLYMYGIGEVPISISGDPADTGRIIHTIRAYGAVTSRMMTLKKQEMIGVRGPFGTHWPIEDLVGRDILLVAGGIGIAPLRPVLFHILSNRTRYGKVLLLYGERTPGDLIFRNQIESWRGRFDLELEVTVDSAREGWRGNVGVVTTLMPRIVLDPSNTAAMLCGPEIMMHYTIQELTKKGLRDDQIYISMERNMRCGIGLCGHCQLGPTFVCKDGPVFLLSKVRHLFRKREL
ncbi:Oxidoreductase FAD/NAD(P)-binding domain protein [uncultured Desulfobacterium sp.]|uniref:Oxidoreductase FAD/NAD(P)-binding domain protein n=1 Tax=uncultured Desulfobacterium sp. TaxID=201089 RepID=A0A445N2S7_9BACT|nr:Oxidoreductase FAD/NAD(P)-binding domain protein [uncultured Desulfobacterium sp.]